MKYYNTPKKNRSLSVYIILSLCLVAIGIGAKTLMTAMSEPSADTQSTKNDILAVILHSNSVAIGLQKGTRLTRFFNLRQFVSIMSSIYDNSKKLLLLPK